MQNPIDLHIGQKLKELRTLLKMSQEQVGELVGITFQQVQKYETGMNRISASRLYELAQLFGKPIGSFFDDYKTDSEFHNFEFKSDKKRLQIEKEKSRETLNLTINFNRINNSEVRNNIVNLVQSLANRQ